VCKDVIFIRALIFIVNLQLYTIEKSP